MKTEKAKTCGECKHFTKCGWSTPDVIADTCEDFEPKKPTNGDVIRQMSNKALATCIEELAFRFSSRREFVAWLNATAESEGKDE